MTNTSSLKIAAAYCGASANEYLQLYTGAQINFADLTPYLIYASHQTEKV
jgi:hypothetical protein